MGIKSSDSNQIPAVTSWAFVAKNYLENIFFLGSKSQWHSLSVTKLHVQERWSLCGPPVHVTKGRGDGVEGRREPIHDLTLAGSILPF